MNEDNLNLPRRKIKGYDRKEGWFVQERAIFADDGVGDWSLREGKIRSDKPNYELVNICQLGEVAVFTYPPFDNIFFAVNGQIGRMSLAHRNAVACLRNRLRSLLIFRDGSYRGKGRRSFFRTQLEKASLAQFERGIASEKDKNAIYIESVHTPISRGGRLTQMAREWDAVRALTYHARDSPREGTPDGIRHTLQTAVRSSGRTASPSLNRRASLQDGGR